MASDRGWGEYLAEKEFILAAASWDPEISVAVPDAKDLTERELIIRGLALAARQDTIEARKILHEIHGRPRDDLDESGILPGMLLALEHELAGRWSQATDILVSLSRRPFGPDTDVNPILVRWMTAESFRTQDLPDSAATYFELVLIPAVFPWEYRLDMRMLSSFAHLRLVHLYAQVGRTQEAKRHLAMLDSEAMHPDPAMAGWLVEARRVLEDTDRRGRSAQ
jgi:hypothetical protein